VLDIRGGNPVSGTSVIMWPKKGNPESNQLWYFDGQGIIRSALNDFALEAAVGGAKVRMMPYTGDHRQQWMMEGNRILNKARECLDISRQCQSDGAELISYQYKNMANQHWRLEFISGPPERRSVADLTTAMSNVRLAAQRKFYIVSEMNCKVLDIRGGNPVSGTSVIMWPKKGSPESNQLWYFDGQGIIRSALNDFAMEAAVGGTKVKMMPYNGDPRQQWTLDGRRIVNRAHECLDIWKSSGKDGAELVSFKYNGTANQHWSVQFI